jgi:ankyrin repeat protein
MIKIILKLNDSLLFKKNKHGEIPIMKHIKNKNINIVQILLDYIIQSNNETIFEIIDNNKNNILHYLCKYYDDNNIDFIRKICILKPEIINNQNKNFETPIILAAKNSCEDIIYFLKGINCDMYLVDIFGNSVYHYICLNELCIGMAIENKENLFGYKPSAYCKISLNYYYFI